MDDVTTVFALGVIVLRFGLLVAGVLFCWFGYRLFAQISSHGSAEFSFGNVVVDLAARTVHRADELVRLTPIEYRLLSILISNAGRVATQRQLLTDAWGPGYVERSHYLRIHLGHLRHKLENDSAQPEHLLTELGVGYRFKG